MSYSKLDQDDNKFLARIEMILDILQLKETPPINDNCFDCLFVQNQKI